MTENEIRNKTNELLEAYRFIAGGDFVPGVKEYILLRKEAIAEMSGYISTSPKKPVPVTSTRKQPTRPVPEPVIKEKAHTPDIQAKKGRQPEPAHMISEPSVLPEPPAGQAKKEPSEFEILQGIKDSWN